MNTWNTQLESCQLRVYQNTPATFQRQIRQGENPTAAVIFCMDAGCVGNAILLNNLTSEVALDDPVIRTTNSYTPLDNNHHDGNMHFGMPGGSRDQEDEGDTGDEDDDISTISQQRQTATDYV
jgi:hypothetical protein